MQGGGNVSLGGEAVDVTDDVHASYRELAVKAVKAIPGMEYGGVDIFTLDYTSPRGPTNSAVSEIEFSPAPTGLFPTIGTPRDIAGAILDFYLTGSSPSIDQDCGPSIPGDRER